MKLATTMWAGERTLIAVTKEKPVLVTAIRVLSPAGNHSPPHLPRMPSKTVLISERDLEAAQILIRSFSYIFLSPIFTAIRTRMLSFVGGIIIYSIDTESA